MSETTPAQPNPIQSDAMLAVGLRENSRVMLDVTPEVWNFLDRNKPYYKKQNAGKAGVFELAGDARRRELSIDPTLYDGVERRFITSAEFNNDAINAADRLEKTISYVTALQRDPNHYRIDVLSTSTDRDIDTAREVLTQIWEDPNLNVPGTPGYWRTAFPIMNALHYNNAPFVIQEAVLSDPKLLEKIQKETRTILKDVQTELPERPDPAKDPKIIEEEKQKKQAETAIEETTKEIVGMLGREGITVTKDLLDEVAKRNTRGDINRKNAVASLYQKILTTDDDLKKMDQIWNNTSTILNLRTIKGMTAAKKADALRPYGITETQIDGTIAQLEATNSSIVLTDEANARQRVDTLRRLCTSDGSPLILDFDELLEKQKQYNNSDATIKDRRAELTTGNTNDMATRTEKERELITRMDTVISTAIIDLMKERFDGLNQAHEDRLTDISSPNIKRLKERAEKQAIWHVINPESGKPEVVTGRIRSDILFLVAPEPGIDIYTHQKKVQQLMLRDLALPPSFPGARSNSTLYREPNILERLNPDEKAILDKAYAEYGSAYQEKLFIGLAEAVNSDYKRFHGKMTNPDLVFNGPSSKRLANFYGEMLKAKLVDSPNGEEFLRRLGLAPVNSGGTDGHGDGGHSTKRENSFWRFIKDSWQID